MSPSRLRAIISALAIVILLLLGQIAWQGMRVSGLKSELEQQRRTLENSVAKLANERLQGRRQEMVRAAQWLEEWYRSPEGLQRPDGLWLADRRQTDVEALGVWIFDVYLNARVAGGTEEQARQAVVDAIRGTDEWRRKHPRS